MSRRALVAPPPAVPRPSGRVFQCSQWPETESLCQWAAGGASVSLSHLLTPPPSHPAQEEHWRAFTSSILSDGTVTPLWTHCALDMVAGWYALRYVESILDVRSPWVERSLPIPTTVWPAP